MSLLEIICMLRAAGKGLFVQAELLGQLVLVEWSEEKDRLLKMLVIALLGFASLLCTMLCAGAMVLAFSWGTRYRTPIALALLAAYGLGTIFAWRRFQALSAVSGRAFAATREEFSADLALLKSRL